MAFHKHAMFPAVAALASLSEEIPVQRQNRYAHMKEIEYVENGERKKLHHAHIGREPGE